MALSRNRFVAYARAVETYHVGTSAPARHPIQSTAFENGALCVRLRPSRLPGGEAQLFAAFETILAGSVRWRLPVPMKSGTVEIEDAITGRPVRRATVRRDRGYIEVRIPLAPVLPVQRIFVKYDRRLTFFDEAGWREVPAPSECSDLPSSAISPSSSSSAPSSFGGGSDASA